VKVMLPKYYTSTEVKIEGYPLKKTAKFRTSKSRLYSKNIARLLTSIVGVYRLSRSRSEGLSSRSKVSG